VSASNEEKLREKIGKILESLQAGESITLSARDDAFESLVDDLCDTRPEQLAKRFETFGLLNHPYGEDNQRCLECMHYLFQRKWCGHPDLEIPVEPEWWCRLWRI
jgi:hypothetical protein